MTIKTVFVSVVSIKRLQYFEDLVDSGKIELPQEFGGFTGKNRSDIL